MEPTSFQDGFCCSCLTCVRCQRCASTHNNPQLVLTQQKAASYRRIHLDGRFAELKQLHDYFKSKRDTRFDKPSWDWSTLDD